MTLPNIFTAGTVASASEVNANFDHLSGIIGSDSTSSALKPTGDVVMGPQDAVQITAKGSSSTYGGGNYFQIGWNANLTENNNTQFNNRVLSDKGATALTLSEKGFSVKSTARSDQTLDEAMSTAMTITPYYDNGTSAPWIYLNPDWKLQWKNSYATYDANANSSHDNTRTTLVFLDPPVNLVGTFTGDNIEAAFTNLGLFTATSAQIYDPTTNGRVPPNPVGLLLGVMAKWTLSDNVENTRNKAKDHIMRISAEDTADDAYSTSTGFIVSNNFSSTSGNTISCYSLTQGIVRLGTNTTGRKLRIVTQKDITAATTSNAVWNVGIRIQGVFI